MMRRRAILEMLLLLPAGAVFADWLRDAEADSRRFITDLPPCDRVVIFRIGKPADDAELDKGPVHPQGPDVTGKLYCVEEDQDWFRIDAQAVLTGARAERVAALYRALGQLPPEVRRVPEAIPADRSPKYRTQLMQKSTMMAKCHHPPFAYRFYAGDQLLYDTSVCWGCENLIVGVQGKRHRHPFRSQEKESVELFNVCNDLFPKLRAIPPWERDKPAPPPAPTK